MDGWGVEMGYIFSSYACLSLEVVTSFNEDFRTNWEKGGGFNLNCTPPHFPYPMKIIARPVLGSKF